MGRTEQIKASEIGPLLRLIHELHEMRPNPVLRHEHLLKRLCAIVDADSAGSAVFDVSASGPSLQFVVYTDLNAPPGGQVAASHCFDPPDEMIRGLLKRSRKSPAKKITCTHPSRSPTRQFPTQGRKHVRPPTTLFSAMSLKDSPLVTVIYLTRSESLDGFRRNQCQMVALLHSEITWLFRRDEPHLPGELTTLSPRQRETLDCLLAGHSEKQIAQELGRSPHTVHIYVKAIYRAFGVNTRAELLARFVSRRR